MNSIRRFAVRTIKDYPLWHRFPRAYAKAVEQSQVDSGYVLFLESERAEMPEAFKLLYSRLESDPSFRPEYVSLHKHRVSMTQYMANCEAFLKKLARASVVFLCDASDVVSCISLRPETKAVQLWHACGAFKKWGMSTADLPNGVNREDVERHPGYENLSLVTVSADEVIPHYAEAMNLIGREGIIEPIGVSRTDVFFDSEFVSLSRELVEARVPAAKGKRIVLYAPTFRGTVAHAKAPDALDVSKLRERIGDDFVLLVNNHPLASDAPDIESRAPGFAFDVTGELPIDELLCAADAMVTDYSSVVFEYSLLGRPMAFFAFDLDDYRDWRSFYYDFDEMTPGPVFEMTEQLAEWLASDESSDAFDATTVKSFCDRFMGACDGHSTDRIFQKVFGQQQ